MSFFKISKFFLYLVPFSVIIVSLGTLFPFIVGKYVFFRAAVGLALIFFLLGWLFQYKDIRSPKINYQYLGDRMSQTLKSPLVIAVAIFTAIFLLACLFSYNPSASFWSNFERGEGGLQLVYFFIFFILLTLLFSDDKSWRRMFILCLIAASLVILYGIAAGLKYIDAETTTQIVNGVQTQTLTGRGGPFFQTFHNFVGSSFGEPSFRFAGSLGNPAYLGTYLIFVLFYAIYLLADVSKAVYRSFLAGLVGVFILFLFLSGTRGAFLGLAAGVIAGLLYLFFTLSDRRLRKIIFISVFILIILTSLGIIFQKSIPVFSRIFSFSLSVDSVQTRLLLWQQAIKIFKERPILGWGPENFSPAFEKHYDPFFEVWYDRAHNIFFDYLVMTGLLGLLSFIGIFVVYYWQFFKIGISKQELVNRGRKQILPPSSQLLVTSALLFSLPIAYLVQGLVLFDVLPIYINLFLFLAFAVYTFSKQELVTRN